MITTIIPKDHSTRKPPARLDGDLSYNFYRLGQLLRDQQIEAFRQMGFDITPEQWHILHCLVDARNGLTPTELAARARRDKTTISRMLDVMDKHGLTERLQYLRDGRPRDGRSFLVTLTQKSREMLAAIDAQGNLTDQLAVFAPLNEAERRFLLSLLQKCRRNANDLQ